MLFIMKGKITLEQAIDIYYRLQEGEHKVFIMDEYKCSSTCLYNIERCLLRWKELKNYVN